MVGGPFGLPTYEDATDLYKFTLSPDLADGREAADRPGPHRRRRSTPSLQLARDTNSDGFIQPGEIIAQSANTGDDAISTTLAAGTYYVVVVPNGFYTSYQLDLDSDLDANPATRGVQEHVQGDKHRFAHRRDDLLRRVRHQRRRHRRLLQVHLTERGHDLPRREQHRLFSPHPRHTPSVAIIRDANNNGIYDNGEAIVTGIRQRDRDPGRRNLLHRPHRRRPADSTTTGGSSPTSLATRSAPPGRWAPVNVYNPADPDVQGLHRAGLRPRQRRQRLLPFRPARRLRRHAQDHRRPRRGPVAGADQGREQQRRRRLGRRPGDVATR